jgi:hypothetical protein
VHAGYQPRTTRVRCRSPPRFPSSRPLRRHRLLTAFRCGSGRSPADPRRLSRPRRCRPRWKAGAATASTRRSAIGPASWTARTQWWTPQSPRLSPDSRYAPERPGPATYLRLDRDGQGSRRRRRPLQRRRRPPPDTLPWIVQHVWGASILSQARDLSIVRSRAPGDGVLKMNAFKVHGAASERVQVDHVGESGWETACQAIGSAESSAPTAPDRSGRRRRPADWMPGRVAAECGDVAPAASSTAS